MAAAALTGRSRGGRVLVAAGLALVALVGVVALLTRSQEGGPQCATEVRGAPSVPATSVGGRSRGQSSAPSSVLGMEAGHALYEGDGRAEPRRIVEAPVVEPSWSRDGGRVAYVGNGASGGERSVFVRDGADGVSRPVAPVGEGASDLAVSPDGTWVAFVDHNRAVWVASAHGGADPVPVGGAGGMPSGGIGWSSDGGLLAYIDRDALHVLSSTNWGPVQLPVQVASLRVDSIDFRPGRRQLGAEVRTPDGRSGVALIDLDGAQAEVMSVVPEHSMFRSRAVWSPDGSRISFLVSPTGVDSAPVTQLCVASAEGTGAWAAGPTFRSGPQEPLWSSDSSSVTVSTSPEDGHVVWLNVVSGATVPIDAVVGRIKATWPTPT